MAETLIFDFVLPCGLFAGALFIGTIAATFINRR